MPYRVDLSDRAARDLGLIYASIQAGSGLDARRWFNGLVEMIRRLDRDPARGAAIPEGLGLRHLIYGRTRHRYRVIYAIDEDARVVSVVTIREGARAPLADEGTISPG
jgi:plasmid stabilization system protein ParE